jgi:hypothetical protein
MGTTEKFLHPHAASLTKNHAIYDMGHEEVNNHILTLTLDRSGQLHDLLAVSPSKTELF